LIEAIEVLKPVEGLAFVYFDESDVVRHHLVQRIIRAYDDHKTRVAEAQMSLSLEARAAELRGEVRNDEARSLADDKETTPDALPKEKSMTSVSRVREAQ